ncbi:class I SAM-dependent methyltransferase [Roseivirga misakiensis]|uniref:Methyltransferase type 12 domain-containing protein n=1 Tax=Roseivirga misakiensis TaxID=1563681 RepID=A0A1E5T1I2_9BACT|nr:class I SAM-dependent methyltransferase [Roseivirga misakiensis]OEK05221.1 hypothetical protein BFP71_17615 [Roseivirga misakiensis]
MSKRSNIDLSKVEKLYSDNIKKFGNSAQSVGWGNQQKQDLRFKQLLKVVGDNSQPFSVNELGCGYGELVKYCEKHEFALTQYDGYDISADMLKAAREYLNGPQIALHHASAIHTNADFTIASGIFNVMFDEDKEAWINHIKRTLMQMYEQADKGISFNLLTKYVDFEAKDLYYADPAYYFDFCKRELSRFVTLIHDYPLYEWTIIVKKESN